MIYDELLETMTRELEYLDTYVLPSEWPKNDLSAYTLLTLTCKQLYDEAKRHFESQYLSKLTLYFDNVPDLLGLRSRMTGCSPEYYTLTVCLVTDNTSLRFTESTECPKGYGWTCDAVAHDVLRLIRYQLGVVECCPTEPTWQEAREGKAIDVYKYPTVSPTIKVTRHHVREHGRTMYVMMRACINDISFSEHLISYALNARRRLDRRRAYEKHLIYEERSAVARKFRALE